MQHLPTHFQLRNHQVFSQIADEQLNELSAQARLKKATQGENIFFTHETRRRIYFVKQGILKIISVDMEGNEIVKDIIQKDGVFGEHVLFSNQESDLVAYAKIISPQALMYTFTLEEFKRILERHPKVSLKFIQQVVNNLQMAERRCIDLMSRDVRTRIIRLLKKIALTNGATQGKAVAVPNYLTHQDIAHLVGATRQTVTTILNELKQENKLDYSRFELLIPNIDRL